MFSMSPYISIDFYLQKIGVNLFHATVKGNLPTIAKLNSASFQDKVCEERLNEI